MKKLFLALVAVLTMAVCSGALAKNITITGIGMTENAATNDALRCAVEQAVGVLIDSETIVDKNVVLKDQIYANSKGFVNQYKVISSQQNVDGWAVTINADVDTNPDSKLMNELTRLGLVNVLRNPKIAVMIPEQHLRYRVPDPAGETAVIKAFIEAGFDNMIDISKERMQYNNPFNLSNTELEHLASSMQADILVVGQAFSEGVGDVGRYLPGNQRTNVVSCRARVEAKMYVARTGQIIATEGKYGSGVDISEAVASKKALENAGAAMGEYLSSKLLEMAAGNKQQMELVVIPTSYDKLAKVQEALQSIRGVKNVNLANYANGRGTFTLQFGGAPQVLFAQLQEKVECNIRIDSSAYNVLTIAAW